MDDYPEMKFACSQAQQFFWVKETYPTLYSRLLERVKQGRFIPVVFFGFPGFFFKFFFFSLVYTFIFFFSNTLVPRL